MRNVGGLLLAVALVLGVACVARATSDVERCGTAIAPSIFGIQVESATPERCDGPLDDRKVEVGVEAATAVLLAIVGATLLIRARRQRLPDDPFAP